MNKKVTISYEYLLSRGYFPVSDLAERHGYAKDHVGWLARTGRVQAIRYGKHGKWYANEKSLVDYQNSLADKPANKLVSKSQASQKTKSHSSFLVPSNKSSYSAKFASIKTSEPRRTNAIPKKFLFLVGGILFLINFIPTIENIDVNLSKTPVAKQYIQMKGSISASILSPLKAFVSKYLFPDEGPSTYLVIDPNDSMRDRVRTLESKLSQVQSPSISQPQPTVTQEIVTPPSLLSNTLLSQISQRLDNLSNDFTSFQRITPTVIQLPPTNTKGIVSVTSNPDILNTETLTVTGSSTLTGALSTLGDFSINTNAFKVDADNKRVGVGTSNLDTAFEVVGIASISSNLYSLGNVGIGTTNPTSTLTVLGDSEFKGTASAAYGLFSNTIQVGGFSSVSYNRFGTLTTGHSNYITNSSDLLVSSDLEVRGTASFGGNASVSGNFYVFGDIGLGTSNTSAELTVTGSGSFTGRLTATRNPTQAHSGTWPSFSNTDDATLYINPASPVADGNVIVYADNGTPKFVIDAEGDTYIAGNLTLVGTTTQATTDVTGDLSVEGNTRLGDAITDKIKFVGTVLPYTLSSFPLLVKASASQTVDTFRVLDPSDNVVFTVDQSYGLLTASSGFNFGLGLSTATVSYSRLGTATTGHSLDTFDDFLITGDLEVDGSVFFDGTCASCKASNSIDFDEIVDAMTLDNNLTIASAGYSFTITDATTTIGGAVFTSDSNRLGVNAGGTVDTRFEVGGTASISGTLTTYGTNTFGTTGSSTFAGSLDVSGGLHSLGLFTVTSTASFNGGIRGSGLADCNSSGSQLLWDITGAKFSCETLADADIPDNITIDLSTLATTLTITDNESSSETNAILFTAGGDLDGGNLGVESDGDLNYNPSTGNISATQFGGITEANLLDKSSSETITGSRWTLVNTEVQGTASASYLLTGNTLQVGGYSSVAYSRFGTSTTGHSNYISTSNDL
ncbi:MAG: hypothetical protein QF535_03475, partial [Anaerolineales bacterium]|nr:hypothetical protein [Anaerolineales bacterium]